MTFEDDFMVELETLIPLMKSMRLAMAEDLSEETLLVIESACARVSTRVMEIVEGVVTDAADARSQHKEIPCPEEAKTSTSPISSPTTTAPENTSSQPAPVDLANSAQSPKLGA